MVLITGDIHASTQDLWYRISKVPELTKDDYLIICGDFGLIWHNPDYIKSIIHCTEDERETFMAEWEKNEKKLDELEAEFPCTILFVDGNHENHDRLDALEVSEWHSGKVHKIREHIIHLMRGEVFEIEGKKYLAFGGADSHDIQGGILEFDTDHFLEDYKKAYATQVPFRINKVSWWEREVPSFEEYYKAMDAAGDDIDVILTHECAAEDKHLLHWENPELLCWWIQDIRNKCSNAYHYCGHYHLDKTLSPKSKCVFEKIMEVR